jgi:ABC-type bacteriocin/lantibiotic exporter with double-glycine peptidase domain
VYQNVTLNFDPGANVAEEVMALLDDLDLTQAVSLLPNGLGTQLGTDAASLSGGQLQRLALARALYQKPSIIVLDEVTSALDPETESTITRLIESLRGRVTVIAIAHRKETLEQADLAIHFEGNGCVAILE